MQDLESPSSSAHRIHAPDPAPEGAPMGATIQDEAVAAEASVPPVS